MVSEEIISKETTLETQNLKLTFFSITSLSNLPVFQGDYGPNLGNFTLNCKTTSYHKDKKKNYFSFD